MSAYQCPNCHAPHNSSNICPECRKPGRQIELCPTHFTGYSPGCGTCRELAGI